MRGDGSSGELGIVWQVDYRLRLVLLTLLSLPAKADAGVPMLFVTWPGMLIALVPIVAVEAWILKPRLNLTFGDSLRFAALANIASTIVGIPLAWLVLLFLELVSTRGGTAFGLDTLWGKLLAVTVQAPWLIAYESELYWMIPAATLALLPAYLLASWGVEFAVFSKLLGRPMSIIADEKLELSIGLVRKAVLLANAGSYAILALVTLLWLAIAIVRGPQQTVRGTASLTPSIPDTVEPTTTGSSDARHRIRIEFENTTRKHVTVRIRMGTGRCAENPLITQELKGDAGYVFTAFLQPNEVTCYSIVPFGQSESEVSGWQDIQPSQTNQANEVYRVTIP